MSGLTKIRDWAITLALLQDEYHLPLLPPELAAYMSMAGELGLPVLLVRWCWTWARASRRRA